MDCRALLPAGNRNNGLILAPRMHRAGFTAAPLRGQNIPLIHSPSQQTCNVVAVSLVWGQGGGGRQEGKTGTSRNRGRAGARQQRETARLTKEFDAALLWYAGFETRTI
jgi:hypothetical protein